MFYEQNSWVSLNFILTSCVWLLWRLSVYGLQRLKSADIRLGRLGDNIRSGDVLRVWLFVSTHAQKSEGVANIPSSAVVNVFFKELSSMAVMISVCLRHGNKRSWLVRHSVRETDPDRQFCWWGHHFNTWCELINDNSTIKEIVLQNQLLQRFILDTRSLQP